LHEGRLWVVNEPQTVAEAYAEWWRHVGNPTTPRVQVDEMRKAFYAGCAAMLELTLEASAEDRSEEEGATMMSRLNAELDTFFTDLLRGGRG
jgi:hypothetical protein